VVCFPVKKKRVIRACARVVPGSTRLLRPLPKYNITYVTEKNNSKIKNKKIKKYYDFF